MKTNKIHVLYSHLHIATTQHQRQTHEGKRLKDYAGRNDARRIKMQGGRKTRRLL